jgi:uncharacterized protein (DUF58 family)
VQVHPQRASVDLATVGMIAVVVGLVLRQAPVVGWGGMLLFGLMVARAVTRLTVSRVRTAGFEMLWTGGGRVTRMPRGETVEIEAEIRNRDNYAARFAGLRAIHAPELDVRVVPETGEVPAGGRLRVTVTIGASRVGRHGIHGLSLELEGNPGLFEVPLTFANPYGVYVLPRVLGVLLRSPRGGRNRVMTHAGRPGPRSGDGTDLRELREHQPGDPFRRIAWKASARRRLLMVRDYEREERDRVWLLLDASIELWSGTAGQSPLDLAVDELARVAERHIRQQDRVGLAVVASRVLAWLPPDRGPARLVEILETLALVAGTMDADRSDLDEADVAHRVLEHMRPLDPTAASRVRASDLDRVARRAARVLGRAPFPASEPYASTTRERTLRAYLARFGLGSPPRQEQERPRTDAELARVLAKLARERPRPSIVYLWSPTPDPRDRPVLIQALLAHPRRQIELRWVSMSQLPSLPRPSNPVASVATWAVSERIRAARERGNRALRQFGLRLERPRLRHPEHGENPWDQP